MSSLYFFRETGQLVRVDRQVFGKHPEDKHDPGYQPEGEQEF